MLHLTQVLIFELGTACNLAHRHKGVCPISYMVRGDRQITDEMIIKAADEAYNQLGFTGLIGWHFYNEPMIYWERMLDLMVKIRQQIPQSRFLLWTNGTAVFYDERFRMFEYTYISNYSEENPNKFLGYFYNMFINNSEKYLDNRLGHFMLDGNSNNCGVPFESFIIGNDGTAYMCCHDWRNDIKIGNLFEVDLKTLNDIKWEYTKKISAKIMAEDAPDTCRRCNGKYTQICNFVPEIVGQATAEMDKL